MPRMLPPAGFVTAKQAMDILNVSDTMLANYVKRGDLQRYGPPQRKHKFYKLDELHALRESAQMFQEKDMYAPGLWRKNPVSTFRPATEQDITPIMEINRRVFPADGLPLYSTWKIWIEQDPECLHVLVNTEGITVGYIALLPMRSAALDAFIRAELPVDNIGPEHLETFRPGTPLHLYVMSLAVDSQYGEQARGEYSMRLFKGVFSFFLSLARRGIEITDITARALSRDGLRVVRKLGLPQVKSPVPGKNLFRVVIAESGAPLFERYSELLAEWKAEHLTPAFAKEKRPDVPRSAKTTEPEQLITLPGGLVSWRSFARLHHVPETTVHKAIQTGRFAVIEGTWQAGRARVQGALDAEGRRRFYDYYHENTHFQTCPDCPHGAV